MRERKSARPLTRPDGAQVLMLWCIKGDGGMHKYILLLAAAGAAQGDWAGFAGTWSCIGSAEASPQAAAHPTRATLTFAPGPWLRVRYSERKTRENPLPQAGLERWGKEGSGWVRYLFDNAGGSGRAESPGWQGDALVWTGEYQLRGEKLAFREIFTLEDGALLDTLELNQAGEWKVMASAACARTAGQ
jgi:hypothetical protein